MYSRSRYAICWICASYCTACYRAVSSHSSLLPTITFEAFQAITFFRWRQQCDSSFSGFASKPAGWWFVWMRWIQIALHSFCMAYGHRFAVIESHHRAFVCASIARARSWSSRILLIAIPFWWCTFTAAKVIPWPSSLHVSVHLYGLKIPLSAW